MAKTILTLYLYKNSKVNQDSVLIPLKTNLEKAQTQVTWVCVVSTSLLLGSARGRTFVQNFLFVGSFVMDVDIFVSG